MNANNICGCHSCVKAFKVKCNKFRDRAKIYDEYMICFVPETLIGGDESCHLHVVEILVGLFFRKVTFFVQIFEMQFLPIFLFVISASADFALVFCSIEFASGGTTSQWH